MDFERINNASDYFYIKSKSYKEDCDGESFKLGFRNGANWMDNKNKTTSEYIDQLLVQIEAYKIANEKFSSTIDSLRNSENTLYNRIKELENQLNDKIITSENNENKEITIKNNEIQLKVFDNNDDLLDFINNSEIELVTISESESYFSVFYKIKDNYKNKN